MTEIAVVFGLAFMIVAYYTYTKDLLEKPKDSLNKTIWSYLKLKDMAVFLHIMGAYLLVGFLGFLVTISTGTTYEAGITAFFTAFAWLTTGVFVIYLSVYIIFRIKEEMMNAVKPFGRFKNK